VASHGFGLVGPKQVRADGNRLAVGALAGFGDHDLALVVGIGEGRLRLGEIAAGPARENLGRVLRIPAPCEQVVSVVERHEALGVPRSQEDVRGVADADDVVARRVEHEQCPSQPRDVRVEALVRDILQELAPDLEGAAGDRYRGLAGALDLLDPILFQEMTDIRGIGGGSNGRDRGDLRNLGRRRQHGGSPQAVPHEQRRRLMRPAQERRRGYEIVDVRQEVGIRELSFAVAEPGEVEAQHRDASRSECRGDPRGGSQVFPAGEAVRTECRGARSGGRPIEAARERVPLTSGKLNPETFGPHDSHPPSGRRRRLGVSPRQSSDGAHTQASMARAQFTACWTRALLLRSLG
jgi:hypothetical protein